MLKKLVEMLADVYWTDERIGKYGEKLTERELKLVSLLGRKGKILKNIYLPKDNEETSEIDVVFITQKGVFVIESKNYSGWIFGDEKSYYWTSSLPNGQKNRFYNPIKQNQTHIKWLNEYLKSNDYHNIPMYSIIAFSERCEIKKMEVYSDNLWVLKRDELYACIRQVWNKETDILNTEEIENIYYLLQPLTNVDESIRQIHISNINKKLDKTESSDDINMKIQNQFTKESTEICPKCGSKLVLRTAKRGSNSGNQFMGCTNFPKCRYIKNL